MKKIILPIFCLLLFSLCTLSFALTPKQAYKGQLYPEGLTSVGKMGVMPTDVIIINNTPYSLYVSAPGIYKDYLPGNSVYRLTSDSTIAPEVILWDYGYSYNNVFDRFVQPHSIISYSVQYGSPKTITVEYY